MNYSVWNDNYLIDNRLIGAMMKTGKPNCNALITIAMILIVLFALIIPLSTIPHVKGDSPPTTTHYLIYGRVFGPTATGGVQNATIELKNTVTGEIYLDTTDDENGSYSLNLANLEQGWEDGQEMILTARYTTFNSITIYPNSTKGGGERLNITLSAVQIISPSWGQVLNKDTKSHPLQILYMATLNVTDITYYIDSKEIAHPDNVSSPNTTLDIGPYDEGTHALKVKVTDAEGNIYHDEVMITIEEDDDESFFTMKVIMVIVGILVIIFSIIGYLNFKPIEEEEKTKATKGNTKRLSKMKKD